MWLRAGCQITDGCCKESTCEIRISFPGFASLDRFNLLASRQSPRRSGSRSNMAGFPRTCHRMACLVRAWGQAPPNIGGGGSPFSSQKINSHTAKKRTGIHFFPDQSSLLLCTGSGSFIKLHGRLDMNPGASPPARHVSAAHFFALAENGLADGAADSFGGGLGFVG